MDQPTPPADGKSQHYGRSSSNFYRLGHGLTPQPYPHQPYASLPILSLQSYGTPHPHQHQPHDPSGHNFHSYAPQSYLPHAALPIHGCALPETSKERKDRKHRECLKARRERKIERRAAGKRDCTWKMYGCDYIIPIPDPEAPEGGHSQTCKYKCDKAVDILWKEVIKYHAVYHNMTTDIWAICAAKASQFTAVEKLAKTKPFKDEPFIFEPCDFWKNKPPSESQISLACFRAPQKPETFLSPPEADYLTIMHQLTYKDHDAVDVQYAVNVQSEELDNFEISIPSVLEELGDERVGYVGYNITPIHSFVDIHVDRGQDTVCIGVGGMEKIWLLWPPTEHNERIFYNNYYKGMSAGDEDDGGEGELSRRARLTIRPKFSATAPHLEFGKIVKTTSEAGMWIPSGWIHCVLTTAGGILAGYTWSTIGRMDSLIACLEKEIKSGNTAEDLHGTVQLMFSLIECEIAKQQPAEKVLTHWIKLISLLNERNLEWGKEIESKTRDIIGQLSKRSDILPTVCPCMHAEVEVVGDDSSRSGGSSRLGKGSKRRQTKITTHILSHIYTSGAAISTKTLCGKKVGARVGRQGS